MFKRIEKNTITYKSVLDSLKKKKNFKDTIDDIGLIIESISFLLAKPLAGTAILAAIETAKAGKLADLLRSLLKRIVDNSSDFSSDLERMDAAYVMICYTAFFDTFSRRFPPRIIEGLSLQEGEKKRMYQLATDKNPQAAFGELDRPNIAYNIEEAKKNLLLLYRSMLTKLEHFIDDLSFVENADEETISSIRKACEGFAESAVNEFEKEYFDLCFKIPEFYSYISLKTQSEYSIKAEADRNKFERIILGNTNVFNAGMTDLKDWIDSSKKREQNAKAIDAANRIIDKARKEIEKPIFGSEQKNGELSFPSIETAFIPQSYKALIYSGDEQLENRKMWKKLPDEENQTVFWAKYFNDPQSLDNLLLILGEPGIGKSLVTKVVTAQMGSLNQIIIRVPLRSSDVEKGAEGMILEQINKVGDVPDPFPTLKAFASVFEENPLTVFFDGYDELQQATGRVYHEFLNKLSEFQKTCMENGRPVRIVVTSRANLIDKAEIPIGTVVLQLNEFDQRRKNEWRKIWNSANAACFEKHRLKAFSLPAKNKEIEKLSGQPLLLLMLAIYDADFEKNKNALSSRTKILRTQLYNELIRRFIRRELTKGKRGKEINYEEQDKEEKTKTVEKEMRRLGTAALGMFVRGKLSITADELEGDLNLFNAKLDRYFDPDRKMLKDEEAFFGSFFFIHDPRPAGSNSNDYHEASFEFLHKTFYEFLVADIVLLSVARCIKSLCKKKLDDDSDDEMSYDDMIESLVLNPKDYLLVLSGASLCAEPVIIEMMKEWAETRLKTAVKSMPDLDTVKCVFKDLFCKHAEMIQRGAFAFSVSKDCMLKDRTIPQLNSAYLMNLITTAVIICKSFDVENELWKYSSQFIRLNLPELKKQQSIEEDEEDEEEEIELKISVSSSDELILRFISYIEIDYIDGQAHFNLRNLPVELENLDLLEARMELFVFLGEDEQKNLYSLHRSDFPYRIKRKAISELSEKGMRIDAEKVIGYLCLDQVSGNINGHFHDLEHIFRLLSSCSDEVFIQSALNTILVILENMKAHGHFYLNSPLEYYIDSIEYVGNRFRDSEGIIKSVYGILVILTEFIESRHYGYSRRRGTDRLVGAAYYSLSRSDPFSKRLLMACSHKELFGESNIKLNTRFWAISPTELRNELRMQALEDSPYFDFKKDVIEYKEYRNININDVIDTLYLARYSGNEAIVDDFMKSKELDRLLRRNAISATSFFHLYHLVRRQGKIRLWGVLAEWFFDCFPDFYVADTEGALVVFCELVQTVFVSEGKLIRRPDERDLYRMGEYVLKNYSQALENAYSLSILTLKACIKLRIDPVLLYSSIQRCFNRYLFDPGYQYVDRLISLVEDFGCLSSESIRILGMYFSENSLLLKEANTEVYEAIVQFFNKRGM